MNRYRCAADLVATVHAGFEVLLLVAIVGAPSRWYGWVTAAVLVVAVPMLFNGGHCWLTQYERRLRRAGGDPLWYVPSMTRRILEGATRWLPRPWRIGRRRSRRAQWWVLFGALGIWIGRLLLLWWQ